MMLVLLSKRLVFDTEPFGKVTSTSHFPENFTWHPKLHRGSDGKYGAQVREEPLGVLVKNRLPLTF
jgi:hypothetical protein